MNSCRACGAAETSQLLELRDVPISVEYPQASREAAIQLPRATLVLCHCRRCGHLFNAEFQQQPLEQELSGRHAPMLGQKRQRDLHQLALELIDRFSLRGRTVLEIGCERGDLLKLICELGSNHGVGMDPRCPGDVEDSPPQLIFLRKNFTDPGKPLRAEFVLCRQVLQRLDFPVDYLRAFHRRLRSPGDCVALCEVPNGHQILKDTCAWDLIYEHCAYFSRSSLTQSFARAGFAVGRIQSDDSNSTLRVEARPVTPAGEAPHPLQQELVDDFNALAQSFAERVQEQIRHWEAQLSELAAAQQKVVVWGSDYRAAAFLNRLSNHQLVRHAVSEQPLHHHRFVPGTGQEILPPEFLRDFRPDCIIAPGRADLTGLQSQASTLGVACRWLSA